VASWEVFKSLESVRNFSCNFFDSSLKKVVIVKIARFRKLKASCFLSYVEYRLNTNTSNIMKNRSH
jgi:hypothetical protein